MGGRAATRREKVIKESSNLTELVDSLVDETLQLREENKRLRSEIAMLEMTLENSYGWVDNEAPFE